MYGDKSWLSVKSVWTLSAAPGIAFTCYVSVGTQVGRVAGASAVLGIAIAGLIAAAAAWTFGDLAKRTNSSGPPYQLFRSFLGELPAFLLAWAIVGECVLGAGLLARSVTVYLDHASQARLISTFQSFSCGPHRSCGWVLLDPIAVSVILLVIVLLVVSRSFACQLNERLLGINFVCALIAISANVVYRFTEHHHTRTRIWRREEFFMEGYQGVFSSAAVGLHGSLCVIIASNFLTCRRPQTTSILVPAFTAFLMIIGILKTFAVSRLLPPNKLDILTPITTYMLQRDDKRWMAITDSLGAVCAAISGIIGLLMLASDVLNQLFLHGQEWKWNVKPPQTRLNSTWRLTIVFTGVISVLWTLPGNYESMIRSTSAGIIFVFQGLLVSGILSRLYKSEDSGAKFAIILFWLLMFFGSPLLVLAGSYFGSPPLFSILQAIFPSCIILLALCPTNLSTFNLKDVLSQMATCSVLCLTNYTMFHLSPLSWTALYFWIAIGVLLYMAVRHGRTVDQLHLIPSSHYSSSPVPKCVSLRTGYDIAAVEVAVSTLRGASHLQLMQSAGRSHVDPSEAPPGHLIRSSHSLTRPEVVTHGRDRRRCVSENTVTSSVCRTHLQYLLERTLPTPSDSRSKSEVYVKTYMCASNPIRTPSLSDCVR